MKSMKMFAICSGLVLSALAAHAETLTIKVPFAFSAGGKTLPAGNYWVETMGATLALRGLPGGAVMMVVPGSQALSAEGKVSASFIETSAGAVLLSVSAPNGMTYTVAPSKHLASAAASSPAGAVLSKRP